MDEKKYIGLFFIETKGYHAGERFECTGAKKENGKIVLRGFWDCGAYTLEDLRASLQVIK